MIDRRTKCEPVLEELTLRPRGPGYPRLLEATPSPPDPLYLRGRLDPEAPAVAIVGARACTRYGREMATRLARDLARAGLLVVSGLARGIDAAAHAATVGVGGRTVAVLPGGLDRPYPPRHRALARSILRRGALITEQPQGTGVGRWSFPRRNRIIAGLAQVTVVVEAAERSGARITAGLALDYGRDVLAVPGLATSPVSRGCHELLADGAHPCAGAEDVLALLTPAAVARLRPLVASGAGSTAGADPKGAPGPDESRLLAALGTRPSSTIDWLHVRTRMPLATLLGALTRLEISGRLRVTGARVDLIEPSGADKH